MSEDIDFKELTIWAVIVGGSVAAWLTVAGAILGGVGR